MRIVGFFHLERAIQSFAEKIYGVPWKNCCRRADKGGGPVQLRFTTAARRGLPPREVIEPDRPCVRFENTQPDRPSCSPIFPIHISRPPKNIYDTTGAPVSDQRAMEGVMALRGMYRERFELYGVHSAAPSQEAAQ